MFKYIYNEEDYGHLVNNENFNTELPCPDLYTLQTNQMDWQNRYIHPDYSEEMEASKEPCRDVYLFPIVSDRFCDDLRKVAETYGRWDTKPDDYVSTKNIRLVDIGFEDIWIDFLAYYVLPLQEVVYQGYITDYPPFSEQMVIARYTPDQQPISRVRVDKSYYVVNIALNTVDVDFEGGGRHFIRFNCSVTATPKGWMLMHPGRITHIHDELKTTRGTRYVLSTFVES